MAKVRFKATDIWDTPEDGNRYEVVDGDLYVTPPPVWRHQFQLSRLWFPIAEFVRRHALGHVVCAPVGVVLDEESGVQPDLLFISNERSHIISERGVEGAPDLVVEVLSPSTQARDRGVKMRRYASAGIPNYWILDPASHTLELYSLEGSEYALFQRCGAGDTVRPSLFPGLEFPADEIWS